MNRPARIAASCFLLLLSSQVAKAHAAGLNVNPIQVYLTPAAKSAVLTVRNDGAEETRYQVSAVAWGEGSRGEMKLEPTSELVFFPKLLTLKPGESRNVRVGSTAQAPASEKTYRVFVEELPPIAGKRPAGVGIRVLTRVSIPVFFSPEKALATPVLDGLTAEKGTLTFHLRNGGSRHFQPGPIRVTGTNATGATIFEHTVPGWYILAGQDRIHDLPLPQDKCPELRELKVETKVGETPLSAKVPVGACRP